jgi:HSP20 family molecular chaperone IbpA
VQGDKVEAVFEDGVLKITLEKQPERKVHKIEVK